MKFKTTQRTPMLERAMKHVREHFPHVCLVVFNREGQWQYMDDSFDAPKFGDKINVSILEDAADEVYSKFPLPAVFECDDQSVND